MSPHVELLARRLAERAPRELDAPAREEAAVAAILAPLAGENALQLLLIRRSSREHDPWSGHMALPGGRRDPGDADLRATAAREALEETGIDLAGARFLGRLDDLRPIRQSERSLSVRPFVYWAAEQPRLRPNHEVAEAFWVSVADLRSAAGDADVQHRGATLRVAAYVIDGRVIWGMTQRVIAALLELAPG